MVEFFSSFLATLQNHKLGKQELTWCVRQSLISEEEAVHVYEALAEAADDALVKAVFEDLANEERIHAGELLHLLNRLKPEEKSFWDKGAQELDNIVETLQQECDETSEGAEKENKIPTPGNLNEI